MQKFHFLFISLRIALSAISDFLIARIEKFEHFCRLGIDRHYLKSALVVWLTDALGGSADLCNRWRVVLDKVDMNIGSPIDFIKEGLSGPLHAQRDTEIELELFVSKDSLE